MLTGRESLIRLIGKRRRCLLNRHSILSAAAAQNSFNARNEGGGGGGGDGCSGGGNGSGSNWVNCPVCGIRVCGDDRSVNSHLDDCLSRGKPLRPIQEAMPSGSGEIPSGTKRKLSQRTLFQLNFCSRTKAKIHSSESETSETRGIHASIDGITGHATSHEFSDLGGEEDDKNRCESPKRLDHAMCVVGSAGNKPHNEIMRYNSLVLFSKMSKLDTPETVDDIYGKALETYIVARKFADKAELNSGATISLLRDPDNPKDPNAIKVLTADSGYTKAVGFLPRELAQYLSPLMDKFGLSFEGSITSVPAHTLAVVPVQIVCQNRILFNEKECEHNEIFSSLWKHVSRVVENAKTHPPDMTKYQQNFVMLIQEVLRSNSHLLTADEKTYLEKFTSLSNDSQRLFIRLYTRKGPWFRLSNISYSEILDCRLAAKGLSATGYACLIEFKNDLHKDNLEEVIKFLTVADLREIMCIINKNCNGGSKKQDLIALLLSAYEDGLCPSLPSTIFEKTGVCIRVSSMVESLIWRAERLFFLNGEQDLSAFLFVDLGIIKFPNYNCIISDQIFSCRNDLLSYEEAIEVAQIMDQSLDERNSELVLRCIEISDSRISSSTMHGIASSLVPFFSCFQAPWVYSKVVLLGISFFEHENRYIDAINLLKRLLCNFASDRRRGYWTLRLSIDLEHVGRLNESLTIAEDGLLDPWVRAGSRISLQRRVLRLGKPPRRWRIPSFSDSVKRKITEAHVQGRPLNCKAGTKSRFYGEDGEQCGVEQLALQYYAGEGGGWQGVHSESGIWLTIFGLLMWDVMFADVPNVFRTKFQTAPLDMETDSFYEARKDLVEPLLQRIQDGMAEEILITSWESHIGTACRGVNWDAHSLSNLRAVVTCIGGCCLALLCRHLAQDYRSWSSGMPDLLLWRFHGDFSGEAKLVEVKGPGDRLSEQQRAWLLFLMDSGFNAEVCKVSPAPVSS